MLESLNYSFRTPPPKKKHNLSNLPHQTFEKLQKKNHGVLRGPLLGKQRGRARLCILRVNAREKQPSVPTEEEAAWAPLGKIKFS